MLIVVYVDYQKLMALRQQLDSQLLENTIVKEVRVKYSSFIHSRITVLFIKEIPTFSQELTMLEAGATVYKLMGPVLVKQDLEEAKQNVGKRIEYITNEM